MRHILVLVSMLLLSVMAGCASDSDLRSMRADTQALERQSSERQQTVEARLQQMGDRVAQFEKSQTDTRRDLARTSATLDELRLQLQRLQGDIQDTQHQLRRGPKGAEGAATTKLVDDYTARLNKLEGQLPPPRNTTPPPTPTAKPEPAPSRVESGPPTTPTPPTAPSASSVLDTTPPPSPAPVAQVAVAPPTPPVAPPTPKLPPQALPTPQRPSASTAPVENDVADQLYKRGVKDYQDRNYEAAVVNLKRYVKETPKASQAANAQYLVGEALYAQKQYEAAIVAFDEVVQKYNRDTKVATAMLKQGYAFAELKDARNARFFLQQVQKKYPNTPEAQQAAEKLKQLR